MMTKKRDKAKSKSHRIDGIDLTNDTLTGRGGLAIFSKYLCNIGLLTELESRFGRLRKNRKGLSVVDLFKQVICFFFDGTSRHLTWFDTIKEDEGYALSIETDPEAMASSHSIKRFFQRFSPIFIWMFRPILQHLFIWRLNLTQPDVILLGIDTMVLDNNEAKKRHGVQPTYKNIAGFQPLQLTWGRYVVDAVFRGGKKHSNHGDTVEKMVLHMVANIWSRYRAGVPIVVVMDSGFFDQKLFSLFESIGIGYVCGGRLSSGVKEYVRSVDISCFKPYEKGGQIWDYLEFGDHPVSWDRSRRAIFCRPRYDNRQALLEFARPDTVLYTNLGMGGKNDERLTEIGRQEWLAIEGIIGLYHGRGRDELVFRSLKDFGFEELPFRKFTPNAAFYYVMLLAFFLSESYKEDVLEGVIPVSAYATTVRRKALDFAAKVVRSGGRTILKVTRAVWDRLNLPLLWERSGNPPKISWE